MHTVPKVLCSSEAASISTATATAQRVNGIGLLGCGTVGSSVARRLLELHPELVRGIAVRDPHKPRGPRRLRRGDVCRDGTSTDQFRPILRPRIIIPGFPPKGTM